MIFSESEASDSSSSGLLFTLRLVWGLDCQRVLLIFTFQPSLHASTPERYLFSTSVPLPQVVHYFCFFIGCLAPGGGQLRVSCCLRPASVLGRSCVPGSQGRGFHSTLFLLLPPMVIRLLLPNLSSVLCCARSSAQEGCLPPGEVEVFVSAISAVIMNF